MLPIRYLSVCAGIEAFSVAARGLPFAPVAFSEIEPFPCAVLAHHYPAERGRDAGRTLEYQEDQSYCLTNPASGGRTHSRNILDCQMQVRRLTPRECERLQGFPDDYTAIPFRGKPAADSPRYRALGNSMAVPVVRWIAERIAAHKFIPLEQPERIKVWEEIEP